MGKNYKNNKKHNEWSGKHRKRVSARSPNQKEVLRQISQNDIVFCAGPAGSGKTHLAAAIVNEVLGRGQNAFFVFVPDLLDHLRSTFATVSEIPYDQLVEQVRNAPLLVLDDLGGHSGTPWAQEKLYQIVNHRYVSKLPTVFTLGLPVDNLELRLQTRLSDPEISNMYLFIN